MDKQRVVVVLLIIAIVLSAINLFMNASFDFGGSDSVNPGAEGDASAAQGGEVSFTVVGGNTNG
jgi:ABC-type cobalt transport system substrate-binding protein